ncbi:3-deoxy-manno-octulosonate cytidylyltransferase [Spirochaetota bacterium]|nr:3-deoxy-manno-octulosonate cytidylyltransferase [Spirochaetota bacterium]
MRILAVIPARLQSTRFPKKLLAEVTPGKPVIAYSYENAALMLNRHRLFSKLIVATDSPELAKPIEERGGTVMLTSPACRNGTERCAEVMKNLAAAGEHYDFIFNLQGDEPMLPISAIKTLHAACEKHLEQKSTSALTLMKKIAPTQATHPNTVKVVTAKNNYALYFSRTPIPFNRSDAHSKKNSVPYYQHIGIYAYRNDFLTVYPNLTPTPLEQSEQLEQLRIIEHGYMLHVSAITEDLTFFDINDKDDLVRFQSTLLTR